MKNRHTLVDNIIESRYEIDVESDKIYAEYVKSPGVVTITHVYVPPKHEGKGIGSEIVWAVLDDVRSKGLQVVPQCQFVAQYIYRHPEWEVLVLKEITK